MGKTRVAPTTSLSIEDLTAKASLLDIALYGVIELARHSTPARGWEEQLTPLHHLALEIHHGLLDLPKPVA